jgi:hypothetical protein
MQLIKTLEVSYLRESKSRELSLSTKNTRSRTGRCFKRKPIIEAGIEDNQMICLQWTVYFCQLRRVSIFGMDEYRKHCGNKWVVRGFLEARYELESYLC